jgi:hypothetical protein
MNIPFDKDTFLYLLQNWYRQKGRVMQSVHPRDLLRTLQALCEYGEETTHMTPELIDEACRCYFVS